AAAVTARRRHGRSAHSSRKRETDIKSRTALSDAHALRIIAEWWESEDDDEQRPIVGRAGAGYFTDQVREVSVQGPLTA
ncbi:hypothetical protein, partial [Streptomyces sp. NPDC001833]|uniref:hypothetical protein n=1 Tax=Streptomyces sp. NPDC001833 TaxID=3154658 RepID=UPI00331D8C8A